MLARRQALDARLGAQARALGVLALGRWARRVGSRRWARRAGSRRWGARARRGVRGRAQGARTGAQGAAGEARGRQGTDARGGAPGAGARGAQATGGRRAGRHGMGAQGRAAGRTVRSGHGRPGRGLGAGGLQTGPAGPVLVHCAPGSVLARFLDPVRLGIFLSHQMNIVHYKIKFFRKKKYLLNSNKIK